VKHCSLLTVVLISFTSLIAYAQNSPQSPWPTTEWPRAQPQSQGLASDIAERLESYVHQKAPQTSCVLIVRNGYLLVEHYFVGGSDTLREVDAISNGVIGLLTGRAVQTKSVDLDQTVANAMPQLFSEDSEPKARSITLRQLLNHTSGVDPSMTDAIGLEDITNLFLMPLAGKPGGRFAFTFTNANILSMVLTEKTGRLMGEYARDQLFGPIGIQKFEWRVNQGYTQGAYGLRLTGVDLARIGLLILHQGKWVDQEVVSKAWLDEATAKQIATDQSFRNKPMDYGYGWWTVELSGHRTVLGLGFAAQALCVVPDLNLIAVVLEEQMKRGSALDLLADVILPAVGAQ